MTLKIVRSVETGKKFMVAFGRTNDNADSWLGAF